MERWLRGSFLVATAPTLLTVHIRYSIKKQSYWQSYWKDKNVPCVKSFPLVGSLIETITTPYHVLELKRYSSLGPIYGQFEGNRPVLTVADPQLIRDIFVKDFAYFPNRKPLKTGYKLCDQMLFFLDGEDWKRIRTIVTPTFTTGKLKRVLRIFKECSKTLVQNFKESAQRNEPIDAKKYLEAFNMDIIASSAFSTKIDSHNDPENEFVNYGKNFFGKSFRWTMFLISLLTPWPVVMKLIKLSIFNSDSMEFFSNVSKQIILERKRTKQTRDDFLQLLLDTAEETVIKEKKVEFENDIAANYGEDAAEQKVLSTAFQKDLTNDELVAQCLNFFVAAYDTTTTLLTYVLYSLAVNEDIQVRAYQEIAEHLQETNGDLTYEAMHKMKYLDNIISEALRLYPPAMRTSRRVRKEYKLGDTGITLEKGMIVLIPILVLHRDPKYYPDPEKFDPDRFSAEEIAKRNPYAYLPFGHGPRNCVGMRFALLTAKVCLVYIISSFKIKTCTKTKIPVEFEPTSFFILHPKDVTIALETRNDSPLVHT